MQAGLIDRRSGLQTMLVMRPLHHHGSSCGMRLMRQRRAIAIVRLRPQKEREKDGDEAVQYLRHGPGSKLRLLLNWTVRREISTNPAIRRIKCPPALTHTGP